MPFTNIKITGSNQKKITVVAVILLVYYYIFYYSQNKPISGSQIELFLGQSLFFIALQNTPLILL